MKIEDAQVRLNAAENCLKDFDYAGALRESQGCLELSVKTLLGEVGISYTTEKGKIPHDVSDKIPQAFEKLEPYLDLDEYNVSYFRKELARAAVLLKLLTSVKQYLDFGVESLAGIKETFDSAFSKELAERIVGLTRSAHWRIYDLISRYERSKSK